MIQVLLKYSINLALEKPWNCPSRQPRLGLSLSQNMSHLMELSKLQTEMALGITASLPSGVKAQFGTMAKPMHAGLAAAAGIDAVLWAKAGMVAAQEGLTGPQGFSASHHGGCDHKAFEGLGQQFLLLSVSHKFHACCHGTHAMLEALKTIKKDFQFLQLIT